MAEWFQAKFVYLGELNSVEQKQDVLADIRIKLGGLEGREAEQVARSLDFENLFVQLDQSGREVVEEVCEILKTLFNGLEPGGAHQRYSTQISRLITHPDETVRSLILHELLSTATHPEKVPQLVADTNLVVAIINRIADENLMVAECAMQIVKKIGETSSGLSALYSGEFFRTLCRLLAKNDTISFRVYEVGVNIAKSSKSGLEATAQSGFLNSLINVLENNDILLQLNALEIITQLALTEEGLRYLEQQEVLRKLVQKIARANEDPLSNLIIPGLMKFFGNVAQYWPNEIFSKYPIVVSALFEVIESGDQTILGAALDTLGHVSSSVEGKYALQALGDSMLCVLKKIAEVIQRMPTELRIRALNNLTLMLDVKDANRDNRILSLTKSWFDSLCDEPLRMIEAICRQPFADIRQAGLEVLAVLASQVWGQEYISTFPGLVEFLLDRSIESFKECKEAKYEIVKNLSHAERDIFDADTMQKLKQFVNEGPLFVDTNREVAVEGAS